MPTIQTFIFADNYTHLLTMADNSVDSIVTDSPYGLGDEPDAISVLKDWITKGYHEVKSKKGFMGRDWDNFVPQPNFWKECFRVLKPGGYLLSFFGTRTYDWGTMAIRLGGFEVRDQIMWIYAQGYPKSLDVSKAIDSHFNAEREVVGEYTQNDIRHTSGENKGYGEGFNSSMRDGPAYNQVKITLPATEEAKQWDGWGTALKPACEPICVSRKPLCGTIAENVLTHGVGAININACRIPFASAADKQNCCFWPGHKYNGRQLCWRQTYRWQRECAAK